MLLALIMRSLVAGAYLVALTMHGAFDAVVALVAVAVVLIWAAPLIRDAICRRRHERQRSTLVVP